MNDKDLQAVEELCNYYHDRLNDFVGHPQALREALLRARTEGAANARKGLETAMKNKEAVFTINGFQWVGR